MNDYYLPRVSFIRSMPSLDVPVFADHEERDV